MEKTYPIREWIKLLEPDIRARLLANMQRLLGTRLGSKLDHRVSGLHRAIDDAFTWFNTAEGRDFWSTQYNKAAGDPRTPDDLRKGIDCTIPEDET